MPGPPFHPDDVGNTIGPAGAFDPTSRANPSVYALQNHLVLEVVAHLQQAGVPFLFYGGTALHTKLPERRRFSSDVDITTTDVKAVHRALRAFTRRFPGSDIQLREPPDELKVDGVRHTLDFGQAPLRLLIEVVEDGDRREGFEPLRVRGDGFDWGVNVMAPTFEGFMGQKLAVLGPNTIGKPVGLNPEHSHTNQGVCKQIFDLRELLHLDLEPGSIKDAYEVAVEEANRLHGTAHRPRACLEDARRLLIHLRGPRSNDESEPVRYGLWTGYRDSRRWIALAARDDWRPEDYRIAGGVITRLAYSMETGDLELDSIRQPLVATAVPPEVLEGMEAAQAASAQWFSEDFGVDARLAWSWAPRNLW